MSLFSSTTPAKPSAFTFPSSTTSTVPTSQPLSLFGNTNQPKPLFGSTTQASSTPSLFGSTATTTNAGGGLFGGTSTAGSSSLFAKPAATTTTPSLFGASTSTPAAGGSLFGTNTASTFGASTGGSLFSNTKPTTTGGGLFGSTAAATTNVAPQPNPQQQVIQNYHPFVRACGNPQVMGTEDDKHIANLNQVAAALGIGKAPYKDGNQILTYNMEGNMFEKFVGIGYNKISERTDDEGFVTLALGYQIQDLNTDERKARILEAITSILGNHQNIKVSYAPGTNLRPLPDGSTEITIIVKEGGFVVGAIKLAQVLNDPTRAAQLEGQLKVDKTRILPKVGMSKAQKERYLETVPKGIDERIWRQAILENPAPTRMLPVAVEGWEGLRDRQKAQIAESKIYQDALEGLANRVERVESEYVRGQVEMEAIRCRHKQLSYRLLRIMLAQWISHRFSKQIDTDEDVVNARCDTLLAKLNRHNQLQAWIANFYQILETNGDRLKEGALKAYDMDIDDQNYARRFLTEILYIGERLVATNQIQAEDLETIRRTLEGE